MAARKKAKKQSILDRLDLVKVIILLAPIMGGFLSPFSNLLLGLICTCGIVHKIKQNKKINMPVGINVILISLYVLSFIPVTFFAVDKGMTIIGFFKNFVIILFMLLYEQYSYTHEEKQQNFKMIPISGSISVIISLIFVLFGVEEIFSNNRLQGLFEYANSYGMFLMLGVVVLLSKEKYSRYDFISLSILLIGIMLTNSRAIIILTLVSMIVAIVFNKQNRKHISIVFTVFIAFGVGISLTGVMEKRIDEEMLQSSEMLTRTLYYTDALKMIKENPFGYGYMGWYYKQAEIQTAMYYTKFVHNSFLQVILDVGIIPAICLLVVLCNTFFNKRQSWLNRFMLILLLGHSIIDIDLEYMIFVLMIIMMLPAKNVEIKNYKYIKISLYAGIVIFSWLTLGTLLYETQNYEVAHTVIPFYTDAMQEDLYSTTDSEKQLLVANKIYKLNKNASGVYEAFSNECVKNGEYKKALEYQKQRLNLNKYTQENYFMYLEFLNNGIEYYSQIGDKENLLIFMNEVCKIENIIEKTLDNTNELSYKTIHPPEIEVNQEMMNYIEQVKSFMENIA